MRLWNGHGACRPANNGKGRLAAAALASNPVQNAVAAAFDREAVLPHSRPGVGMLFLRRSIGARADQSEKAAALIPL